MVRSSARIFTGSARDSIPIPSARKCGQGKPLPSQVCGARCAGRMCGAVLTCIAGDRARRCEAAAQLSSNRSKPALRDCAIRESVPGQTCRTPRGSSRGRDSPRSIGRRQSGSPAASWHWHCKDLGCCCQLLLHWTASASGDVCSPMIRIEYNEDAFISCSIGLDHPGSNLHIYPDCWLCDLFCTISSSNGS